MFTDNEEMKHIIDDSNINIPWIKLSKNNKIKLVREYARQYSNNVENNNKLEDYLVNSIMKNRINKAKDVDYDIANGVIKNIPNLYFNDKNKNYSFKNTDFRKNILRNLTPKNKPSANGSGDK
jgi:broad specificity polyphosphatase/5'/3'-nucleotidase SurE